MQENKKKCMDLANRIYDLDEKVYKCVGSALGRTFTGNRESTVQNLCMMMLTKPDGHLLRSELAIWRAPFRIKKKKAGCLRNTTVF